MEGRGSSKGEVGFASMDALGSELSICQFLDSLSYARLRVMLHVLDPVEVSVNFDEIIFSLFLLRTLGNLVLRLKILMSKCTSRKLFKWFLSLIQVIVPESVADNGSFKNPIVEMLQNSFPDIEVTKISRRFFK